MIRIFAVIFAILTIPVRPLSAKDLDGLLAQGDSLFEKFDYVESAHLYRQACALDSSRFESFWKLGRSLNLEGETAVKDSQLAIFEGARDAENHALELREGDADAHFQLARALGKIALFKGIFKSASLAKQVRRECQRALELDSLHDGAWHILGRWNREVGRKSKFLRVPMGLKKKKKKDAIAFMQKAISLNPEYINHHLEMGITYMTYDRKSEARSEFEKCLAIPAQRPLDKKYKDEAKKYLAELDKK